MDMTELDERQDAFITEIVEEYGEQTFTVLPANLLLTLTDIHYRIEAHGLRESVPAAMSETLGVPAEEGTVDVLVRWRDRGGYIVGVYPIFPDAD